MNRDEKKQLVETLNESFKTAQIVLIAHYAGLTVDQMSALRSEARKNNTNVKVAKNSLIKLAIKDTDFANLDENLEGPTLLIFSDDIVAAAKVLVNFAKQEENEALAIKLGSYNKSIVSESEIVNISKMPSLDEIRAKLISLIQAPATKIACVLGAPATKAVGVINAYSKK